MHQFFSPWSDFVAYGTKSMVRSATVDQGHLNLLIKPSLKGMELLGVSWRLRINFHIRGICLLQLRQMYNLVQRGLSVELLYQPGGVVLKSTEVLDRTQLYTKE